MKKREKFFVNIVANLVIALCVFSVFNMCFAVSSEPVSGTGYSAIYRGDTTKNNASLMINVYWGTEFIQPMMDVLKNNNVNVTFFVGGSWASANAEMLLKMKENGHEIANHGYYHKDSTKISLERNKEEIQLNHNVIKSILNIDMTLFAPPSGAYNLTTLQAAESLNYKTIMWTKDTIDWRDKSDSLILSRATKNIANGDLILMHPTQNTLNVLDSIIKAYKNAGINLTTVSNTL